MSPRARTAIIGVGATEQGEIPGQSANEIAVRAAALALADAGIDKSAVDGLVTCPPPLSAERAGIDDDMGQLLGINPTFSSTLHYGACGFSLHLGAMAIASGLATTVLLTYGTNQRSAKANFGVPIGGGASWAATAGFLHVAGPAAMAAQQHMHRYGTTEEQLGWVAVAQREWAQRNPIAIFRSPLSIEDYLASPYTVAPLRRHDLTMVSDGGTAVVLTSAERARDTRARPVYLLGMAQQSALRNDQNPDRFQRPWMADIADRVYRAAGVGASDIDIAYLQDATSVWVLQQLEQFGFCKPGEAGPFLAEGHTRPGGSLPVNTHGGQLSESYTWNWMHLYEAVRQLRGECGDRQVAGARTALHSQTHDFFKGAATVLSTGDDS
ncbi:thiolase C-terminal domain-containing protein [Pseudonocardia sp. GCM10023141]|uniref:thiolase C-terminal domain-containing protein n=1 Tax=Pseudonocardia sp. GCM10023141 TaxID=3252653 RepID=UPI003610B97D